MLGPAIFLFILGDVFLTMFYARAGTGVVSDRLAPAKWLVFCPVNEGG